MSDVIHCGRCQHPLRVPEALLGRLVQCPSCGLPFAVTSREEGRPPTTCPAAADEATTPHELDCPRAYAACAPHRGKLILTLGFLSLFCFGFLLGPVAWIMGNRHLREMATGRMNSQGEGLTSAGRLLGIAGTFLSVAWIVLWLMFSAAV